MDNITNYNGISSENKKILDEIEDEYEIQDYIKGLPTEEDNIINIDFTDFAYFIESNECTTFVTSIKDPITEDTFNYMIKEIQGIIGLKGNKPPEIRFYNLPEKLNKDLTRLGAEDIGHLVNITGTIIAVDEHKTRYETAVFECNGCMTLHHVKQVDNHLMYPTVCTECGNRNFRLASEDQHTYTDTINIIVEETNPNKTHQNKIKVVLEDNLTHEIDVNQEVNIIGIAARDTESKKNDTHKATIIKANNVVPLKEKQINLTEEDKTQLKELSKQENILEILVNSFAPNIILDNEIKGALLCYLVKGVPYGQIKRNDIHVLFIADPSTAKSRISNYITDFTNKYTKANGTTSTGVGLIGAVVKEPLLNTNVLELGAFPRANKGHCIIDEFDKLDSEDASILLNSMEDGYTNIQKAGVHREDIETKVSVLALANPKFKRFDPYKSVREQITFHADLLSRFDFIFLLQDKPNTEKDYKIAEAILSEDITEENTEENITRIDHTLLKKYIEYARSITPVLTKRAKDHIKEYYVTLRSKSDNNENILSSDTRLFESIVRIAAAITKLKLSTEITNTEIEEATHIIDYCLLSLGQDPETSEIDIDRIRGNYDASDKRNRDNILAAISELSRETVDNGVKQKDLLLYVEDMYNIKRNTFYDTLKQLETHKDINIKTSSSRGNPKVIYLTDN